MTHSVCKVANQYGCGQHTVLHWIANGDLAAINVARTAGGKPRWRISDAALEAFEIARSAQPVPSKTRKRRRRDDGDAVQFY